MQAVIVSLNSPEQADVLFPHLKQAFGSVFGYNRGRRRSGGLPNIVEARLKRLYPQYLLRRAVLLIVAQTTSAMEVVDEVLGMVARMEDPAGATVELLSLSIDSPDNKVGSAGN